VAIFIAVLLLNVTKGCRRFGGAGFGIRLAKQAKIDFLLELDQNPAKLIARSSEHGPDEGSEPRRSLKNPPGSDEKLDQKQLTGSHVL
jgi:hypothetical protein